MIWLDAALAPRLRDPDGLPSDVLDALRLGAADRLLRGTPPHAAVDSWVEIVKERYRKLAGLANAVLRRVEPPESPDPATRLSLPPWLLGELRASLGDDAEPAAAAMLEPAPLWVTALAAGAAEALAADGAEPEAGPLPGTFAVRAPKPLGQLGAYRSGLIQPQNPASSVAVRLLGPEPGERVLDLAAGRGVKSAQLAAAGAQVVAVDRDAERLAAATRNLARLGLHVDHRTADLTVPVEGVAPAPAALLDAPCSGIGTLRGHPEIKLRLGRDDVTRLAALQRAMLDTAAGLVAPGGRLVYAVCTLTRAEGPEQIAAFLERHPSFRAAPWPGDTPGGALEALAWRDAGPGAWLIPEAGLDGFFFARLTRD